MANTQTAPTQLPLWREVHGLHVVSLCHLAGDTSAAAPVLAIGLPWPLPVGLMTGGDPYLAWRSPNECLLLSTAPAPALQLINALRAGHSESAIATSLSESLAVFELLGPQLDAWLAHLVDVQSIPRAAGCCSRARLADVAVVLMRLQPDKLWLLADKTLTSYLQDWLAFSHAGAFAELAPHSP